MDKSFEFALLIRLNQMYGSTYRLSICSEVLRLVWSCRERFGDWDSLPPRRALQPSPMAAANKPVVKFGLGQKRVAPGRGDCQMI